MNRSLDERIHDLYTELVADAPTAPPLPSPTSAPAPARATAWPRILAGAAVTLVIVGLGAVVVMSDVSSDTAPSGAAATAAPTQERSRVDITFLVDVPVEVVPDASAGPGVAAALNRTCVSANERFALEVPRERGADRDSRSALAVVLEELLRLQAVADNGADAAAGAAANAIADTLTRVTTQAAASAAAAYTEGASALADLGGLLAELGAGDCAMLGTNLP